MLLGQTILPSGDSSATKAAVKTADGTMPEAATPKSSERSRSESAMKLLGSASYRGRMKASKRPFGAIEYLI